MNWKLAFLVALIAIPGPVAISWQALPLLIDIESLTVPLQTLQIATALQSIVLVVLASGIGALLSAKVGLRAPVLSALASGGDVRAAIGPQLLPGVIGGFLGAAVITGFYEFSPSELAVLQEKGSIPFAARVLYGGVTEEVLIRWGLMTILVWAGWRTLQHECGVDGPAALQALAPGHQLHDVRNVGATLASGSFRSHAMVVAPCSMRTLAAIAHGLSDNLLTRAADVTLKERRRLVLMVRETPFNLAHLRNMTAVTEMGGIVFPPLPAFYHRPQTIDELVNDTVERVLDLLGVRDAAPQRWQGL